MTVRFPIPVSHRRDRAREGLFLLLYRVIGMILTPILPLLQFLARTNSAGWRYNFAQRLGKYGGAGFPAAGDGMPRIWLHAASVGELRAAAVLLQALDSVGVRATWLVTTMTEQGHHWARNELPAGTCCLLAPLDIPVCVRRAMGTIRPDLYICLETELWPLLLTEMRKNRVPMLLLNGRMSARSFRWYRLLGPTMARLLSGFRKLVVIGRQDAERFAALGVEDRRIRVAGNVKFDRQPRADADRVRQELTARLSLDRAPVFVCGSTRSGEEDKLLGVYQKLAAVRPDLIWIIAPRHLERLGQVEEILARAGLGYDLYSSLDRGHRRRQVVLVDRMGVLADLYSVGTWNFCGGSLVNQGGHNIMEPVQWGRPVYFGPHMNDFREAADMLLAAGAGFQVMDADGLGAILERHLTDRAAYERACRAARQVAKLQGSAAAIQVEAVRRILADPGWMETAAGAEIVEPEHVG